MDELKELLGALESADQQRHLLLNNVLGKMMAMLQGQQVAFTAALSGKHGTVTLGPFPQQTTLLFKDVLTNVGNAYNDSTGAFTAPVKGLYHFEFHIGGIAGSAGGAVLYKNNELVAIAYEEQARDSAQSTATNGANLLLEAGDVITVRQYANTKVHDSANRHTTFSGHLQFPM